MNRSRLRREWVLMAVCSLTPDQLPYPRTREVSRHWTRRGAEAAYRRWSQLPAAPVWQPVLIHRDEVPSFTSRVTGAR